MTALVWALRSGELWLFGLAGLLLGLATLTRPVAQALVPVIPLVILLVSRSWRRTLVRSAVALGVFGLVLAPLMVSSAAEQDSASVGSLGQSLIGRTARHDRGAWTYYDPALHADEPEDRIRARKILQQAADSGSSGKAVHTRLRRELGLTPAEADRLMRNLAIEAILRRPDYYVTGTLQRFVRMADGSVERLRDARNTADTARQRWEDEPSKPPAPAGHPGRGPCGAAGVGAASRSGSRATSGRSCRSWRCSARSSRCCRPSLAAGRRARAGDAGAAVHQRGAGRQRLALPLPGRSDAGGAGVRRAGLARGCRRAERLATRRGTGAREDSAIRESRSLRCGRALVRQPSGARLRRTLTTSASSPIANALERREQDQQRGVVEDLAGSRTSRPRTPAPPARTARTRSGR